MKRYVLGDHDRIAVKNILRNFVLSPQGRTLGRWFTAERYKTTPDMDGLKEEVNALLNDVFDELYMAEAPKLSGTP